MAYARFGKDSDVYVFRHSDGYFYCCMCGLDDEQKNHIFIKTKDLIGHLNEHKEKGHKVPISVSLRLKESQEENDNWIKKMLKARVV